MIKWKSRLARLSVGGATFGIINAAGDVNLNQVLFEFLIQWLSVLVALLFGADPGNVL